MKSLQILSLIIAFSWASLASGADYYCIVFSHDSVPVPKAALSHSFATFIEVEGRSIKQTATINWGPKDEYRLFDGKVEGMNRSMISGIETPLNDKTNPKKVTAFGPYKITPETFQAAQAQITRLESGRYMYQVIDRVTPLDAANAAGIGPGVNCIHAITDSIGNVATGKAYGVTASTAIVSYFRSKGAIVDASEFYLWIRSDLGLDKYTIEWSQ